MAKYVVFLQHFARYVVFMKKAVAITYQPLYSDICQSRNTLK